MSKVNSLNPSTRSADSLLDSQYLERLYAKIREVYLADNRPWVIGFSGGKDSTATLQVIWTSLSQLPPEKLSKTIFVISSDTYVETPVIVNYIDEVLENINTSATNQSLPFEAHKVTPQIDNTFWVNLIGRGYPAPYSRFRWCTDRLKIEPANRFITEKVTSYGEVVVVLGARRSESASRAGQMKKRKQITQYLTRHCDLPNAWVFTPIEDWHTEEVWDYILTNPSPWGSDNQVLLNMYRNAQDGECPMVIDKSTPPCGNSRFGCWTCTVVAKDSSMESMVNKGEEWMRPLLDFRNWLAATQDPAKKKKIRDVRRRIGQVQYQNTQEGKKLIWGPYLFSFRQEILKKLLKTQNLLRQNGPDPQISLIDKRELLKIRQIWSFEEGDWQDSLPAIYEEVTGEKLNIPMDDWSGMGGAEFEILQQVCKEHALPVGMLTELFDAERRQHGMYRRSAIYNDIHTILSKDWRSRDDVFQEACIIVEEADGTTP